MQKADLYFKREFMMSRRRDKIVKKFAEKSYTVLAGCEVSSKESAQKQGLDVKVIPAGKYAKFVIKGDVRLAVGQAWGEIWNTPLERTFTGDFEEYQEDSDGRTATVFIYIAVK